MDELICYDAEKNNFIKMTKEEKSCLLQNILIGLVDLETWEGELPEPEQFKFFEEINKNNNNKNSTYKIIKNLCITISKKFDKNFKLDNFKIVDYSYLKIDYSCIINLNFILISSIYDLLKEKDFENKIKFLYEKNYDKLKLNKTQKYYINLLEDFETIKTININLSKSFNEKIIDLDFIYFFYLFLNFLFPNILQVEYNFNSEKINQIFRYEKNPYRMTDKNIIKTGRKNSQILFSNYILTRLISKNSKIQNLKIKILDSFIIELNDNIINNISILKGEFHFNNFIYISNLLELTNIYNFICEFNSLDSILFEKINFLLIKNISIESLTLNLFPKGVDLINIRKIFMNECYTHNFKKLNEINQDEFYIDFIELDNFYTLPDNINVLKEETIFKILLKSFNTNLKNLIVILDSKIRKLKYLKIIINPNKLKNLLDFQEYNCMIGIFILNLFAILNTNKNYIDLIEFKLDVGGFSFKHFENTFKEFFYPNFNLNDLKISKLSLNLRMDNFIKLNQLPDENLICLELNSISIENLIEINKKLFENHEENKFHRLTFLKIKVLINFDEKEFIQTIEEFLNINKPLNLEKINLTLKNKINNESLYRILKIIHKNSNKDKIKQYNLCAPQLKNSLNICSNKFDLFYHFQNSNSHIEAISLKINKLKLDKLFKFIFCLYKTKYTFRRLYLCTPIRLNLCKLLFFLKDKRVNIYDI